MPSQEWKLTGHVHNAEDLLTDHHRIVLTCSARPASFWHDIPLYPLTDSGGRGGLVRMLCLTPSGSRVHGICAIHEPFTPLRLSRVNEGGWSRFAEPAKWNLGVLPQTLSAPRHAQESQDLVQGDGRPIQILDIGGHKPRKLGDAYLVKPFGALLVTDRERGVQKWTIVSVAADHQLETKIRNMGDAERLLPGMMEEISDWERTSGCLYTGALEQDINPLPPGVTPVDIIGESHKVWEDLCGDMKSPNYSPCYDLQQWTRELQLLTDEPATSAADVASPAEPAADCAAGDADLAAAGKSRSGGEHYDAVWMDMFREEEELATAALPSPSSRRRFPFPPLLCIDSDSLSSLYHPQSSNHSTPSPSPSPRTALLSPRTALLSPLSRESGGPSHPLPSEGTVRRLCHTVSRKGLAMAGSVGRHTGMESLGRGMGMAVADCMGRQTGMGSSGKEMGLGVAGSVKKNMGMGLLGRGMGLAWKKEAQKEAQIVVTLKEKRGLPPIADVATRMQSQDSTILGVAKSEKRPFIVSPRGPHRPMSQQEVVFRAMRIREAEFFAKE